MKIGSHSPWGTVQHVEETGDKDVVFVSTASHGGYRVLKASNDLIPEAFRSQTGWYEEDCDYAVVDFFIPIVHGGDAEKFKIARKSLQYWHKATWETYFDIKLSEVRPTTVQV